TSHIKRIQYLDDLKSVLAFIAPLKVETVKI
ncbi:MAG: hypothetical protein ACI8UG_001182, partial [Gammaproteobacteria bacterium]